MTKRHSNTCHIDRQTEMKRFIFITVLFYAAFFIFVSYSASKAYFASMAAASGNTFTAAAEFPNSTPSATPTLSVTPSVTEAPTPTITETPTPTPGAGSVVINEIMWMGSASSSADEWIELKNTTGTAITMTNWVVEQLGESGNPNIQFSGTIPANGFFLIANTAHTGNSILNITADVVTTNIGLLDSGEQLVLKDNSSLTIDTANSASGWLKGVNGATGAADRSMERKTPALDGTLATSWHTSNAQTNLDGGSIDFATPKANNSSGL